MDMISVIIPCHNNQRILPWVLQAIHASRIPSLEVICIDDASDLDIRVITEAYGAHYLRLPEDHPGRRALARNRGHRAARGTITLYLDGDIIPEPRIVLSALQMHAQRSRVAIKYPVYNIREPEHDKSLPSIASLIISQESAKLGPYVRKHCGIDTCPVPRRLRDSETDLWFLCASHCTSVEWQEVEASGGWDESFIGWGEEDLELAYRLYRNGLKFIYPKRKHGAAYHLDHPRNWASDLISLDRNVRYFREKFPDSWPGRKNAVRFFLQENGLPTIPALRSAK